MAQKSFTNLSARHYRGSSTRTRVTRVSSRDSRRYETGKVNKCVKYCVFVVNVVFWLASFATTLTALWAVLYNTSVRVDKFSQLAVDPFTILLGVGAIIFFTAFFGCIGALRENELLLRVYIALLGLLLVAGTVSAVLLLVFKDQIPLGISNNMEQMIVTYMDDKLSKVMMDSLQQDLGCCGVGIPDDWQKNVYFNCSSPSILACSVPNTCCKVTTGQPVDGLCGQSVLATFTNRGRVIHTEGCSLKIMHLINDSVWILTGIMIVQTILQVLGILASRKIISDIEMIKAYW